MDVGDPYTGSPLMDMYPGSRGLFTDARWKACTARSTCDDTPVHHSASYQSYAQRT
jgi:hypothetical protein